MRDVPTVAWALAYDAAMRPYLPALAAALVGGWAGTFWGGAGPAGAATLHLLLIAAAVWAAPGRDPLGLGRGWPLPWGLTAAAAASLALSPVPRAGLVAVTLLPAFLAWPAAVARCWRDEREAWRGAGAIAVVVVGIALWALVAAAGEGGRTAEPLGHHLLLGGWLVTMLPLAIPAARGRVGIAAAVLLPGVAAVMATRSVAAVAGLAVAALVGLRGRARLAAIVAGVVAAIPLFPRAVGILSGADVSTAARGVYWAAGLAGWRQRPLLGHGPGAVPWTIAEHLRPVPGVNPPGELVGDLHGLPIQLLYELGAVGLAIAAAVAGLLVVGGRRRAGAGEPIPRAGRAGLAGGLTTLLAGVTLGTAAPWLALATAAGAVRAPRELPSRRRRALWLVYAAAALVALAPRDAASVLWERARHAPTEEAAELVARASSLDPGFPLYAAYAAWTRVPADAEGARAAAVSGSGVGPLWLAAGELGAAGDATWAPAARARACTLEPFGAIAPFRLALAEADPERAAGLAARAFAAAPALGGAVAWDERPELLARAVARLRSDRGLPPAWRAGLYQAIREAPRGRGSTSRLVATADGTPSTSMSLFLFRRRPWPVELASVRVRDGAADAMAGVPSAASLPGVPAGWFGGCD